jgi:hypothetical protein
MVVGPRNHPFQLPGLGVVLEARPAAGLETPRPRSGQLRRAGCHRAQEIEGTSIRRNLQVEVEETVDQKARAADERR